MINAVYKLPFWSVNYPFCVYVLCVGIICNLDLHSKCIQLFGFIKKKILSCFHICHIKSFAPTAYLYALQWPMPTTNYFSLTTTFCTNNKTFALTKIMHWQQLLCPNNECVYTNSNCFLLKQFCFALTTNIYIHK